MIKVRGINYNAGIEYNPLFPVANKIDLTKLRKDLILIKKLNCNAIRFYGSYIDKLILYSQEALKKGFEVWISPRLINGDKKQTIKFVGEASKKAEELRKKYKKVIFIVGNELIIDSAGIFPFSTIPEKMEALRVYLTLKNIKDKTNRIKEISKSINNFLRRIDTKTKDFIEDIRKEATKNFKGKITYASFPSEEVDWEKFDIISINLYKNQWNESTYKEKLRQLKQYKKPIAITEFGTCAYIGASKKGGSAYDIIDYKTNTIKEGIIRDENEQSEYLKDLIELYKKENIFATFVFDFKEEWKIHRKNSKKDFDLGSFGIMKVLENGKIFPKKAFDTVKKNYSK